MELRSGEGFTGEQKVDGHKIVQLDHRIVYSLVGRFLIG
jgi:hypothetical protein